MIDINNLSNKEIRKLLDKAKQMYYSTGEELIPDSLYDELEKKVGLENKNYVGTHHNLNYTIKHPFMMGSISKVQIHEKDGVVDWETYFKSAIKFFGENPVIVTPKFDGCSWELVLDINKGVKSISSRGDGEFGKNLYNHLIKKFNEKFINSIIEKTKNLYPKSTKIVLRGEALIKKTIWEASYKELFVNTRAMASGILNHDYDDTNLEFINNLNNINIICYFVAINTDKDSYKEVDWIDYINEDTKSILPEYYFEYKNNLIDTSKKFENLYNKFKKYRNSCEYPLDGIVIKPSSEFRTSSINEQRPSDTVAIKFIPQLRETTIKDIVWNLGKTGEMIPTIIFEPVIMDDKTVTRASAHNYGYLIDNKISIGTKIIVSLAGDIIPYIYKVTNNLDFNKDNLGKIPDNTKIDGCHLIYIESEEEKKLNYLYNTLITLNIDGLSVANAKKVVEYINETYNQTTDEELDFLFGEPKKLLSEFPKHALMIDPTDIGLALGGKTGSKIEKNFKKYINNINLSNIIESCNFRFCGKKVSQQVTNKLLNEQYDFTSMALEGYSWVDDKNSKNYKLLIEILTFLGKSLESFKEVQKNKNSINDNNKIPIIMTGEPNNYSSKREFLRCHPEYVETGSWKAVKIVFTNSLESNTGKMKKAREKNIEIKLY